MNYVEISITTRHTFFHTKKIILNNLHVKQNYITKTLIILDFIPTTTPNRLEDVKTPLTVFLFIGILSVFYAEVNSGSSPTWFSNPWGLLIFWLYFAHLIFYVNIAIREHRVSLTHLYLLGCLEGLYEGPITKVLYHGYPNGQPAGIVFLGFAVLEFIMLVFFWHPIFSFMLPVIVFELLSLDNLQKHLIHSWLEDSIFFTKPRLSKFIFLAIAIIGAVFLSVNASFNVTIILFSGIVNFFLLFIFKRHNLNSDHFKGIKSLYISNKWLFIVFMYLVALYMLTFFFIEPQNIPQAYTLVLTGLIYLFILSLFLISPEKLEPKSFSTPPFDYNKIVQYSWTLWLILLVIIPFIAGPVSILLVLMYLVLLAFGLLLFINRAITVFITKIRPEKLRNL